MRRGLLLIALALTLPAPARAADVTMVAQDVAIGSRALQAAVPPIDFNMLGLHWQGSGSVAFRTQAPSGGWRPWRVADADTGPDPGARESHLGWHDGNLDWTDSSIGVQFRLHGAVSRLRAYYLWSRVVRSPSRSLSIAGSPSILPRSQWEADEKIVRASPRYAPALKLAVVHHTAGTNAYTAAQAPAIVRGIEAYHVQANGWNDIGYNFLVDRFGNVYEGRGGGIDRNVIGAHSLGFNTGTTGVALIGNFSSSTPPPAMQEALVRLLAWRLDIGHVDPLSTVAFTSGGNPKFRAGRVVRLPAISGHRDTGPTECPGSAAYSLLGSIRDRAAATGLPKLYAPQVTGAPGGPITFRARLSTSLHWTLSVTTPAGVVVARHDGRSSSVDWTWPSQQAGRGPFTWTLSAGASLLPATGRIGARSPVPTPQVPAPPTPTPVPAPVASISGLSVSPSVLTPPGDGSPVNVTVSFTLAEAAFVTVQVVPSAGATGLPVSLLASNVAAGPSTFRWDVGGLGSGRYTVTVSARPASGTVVTQTAPLVIDRTLTGFSVSPAVFSPNGDGVNDTLGLAFALGASAPVLVSVQQAGTPVATVFSGQLGPGPQTLGWDGSSAGVRLADGAYVAVVTVTSPFGTVSLLLPFTIDTVPPALTLVDGPSLRFTLGEAATLTAVVNGQPVTFSAAAGPVAVPWTGGPVTSFTIQARDAAGNAGDALSGP